MEFSISSGGGVGLFGALLIGMAVVAVAIVVVFFFAGAKVVHDSTTDHSEDPDIDDQRTP